MASPSSDTALTLLILALAATGCGPLEPEAHRPPPPAPAPWPGSPTPPSPRVLPELPALRIAPISGLAPRESGGTATIAVALATIPAGVAEIELSTSDPSVAVVSPARLVFTPSDWSTPRTVALTAVDDRLATGDRVFALVLDPGASIDPGYARLDPVRLTGTAVDDGWMPPTLVSTSTRGGAAHGLSYLAAMSADGLTVAFTSHAPDLVGGDENGHADVFVWSRRARRLLRVSAGGAGGAGGPAADADSTLPGISADGRWVTFVSSASTLAGAALAGRRAPDRESLPIPAPAAGVYRYDLTTGQIQLVPVAIAGEPAPAPEGYASLALAADGGTLVLGPVPASGSGLLDCLIACDLRLGGCAALARAAACLPWTALSGDGRVAVFGDDAGLHLLDRRAGREIRFSGDAGEPVLAADGHLVVFTEFPGTGAGSAARAQIRAYDTRTAGYELISAASSGAPANGRSDHPSVSADGVRVVFASDATDLLGTATASSALSTPNTPSAPNGIYLRDRAARTTARIGTGGYPAISADGRFVAFTTTDTGQLYVASP